MSRAMLAGWWRNRTILACLFLVGALLMFGNPLWRTIEYAHEDLMFSLSPSASRAFAYGERHFNAQIPGEYDIVRAEEFFKKATELDSSLPYLYHELARISFLRGDLSAALILINLQIKQQGDNTPNSYYVRGLIEGYMGNYADSAKDYEYFLKFDPNNWAGINDLAWVLMKDGRYAEAAKATSEALKDFPSNPWLLNSNAIALYETGQLAAAEAPALAAVVASNQLTEAEWLHAYPGNDPKIAADGIAALRAAAEANAKKIQTERASTVVR